MIDYLYTPNKFLSNELEKVGVKIADKKDRRCVCVECGEEWIIEKPAKGKQLPENFWKCPNQCNTLSLRIRSIGPGWALWELPDGTPFVGNFNEAGNIELSELQAVEGELYDKFNDRMEDDCDTLSFGLDWEIYEDANGIIFVADNESGGIYTLKLASDKIKKIYEKGKDNQYSVAGDLGMHT